MASLQSSFITVLPTPNPRTSPFRKPSRARVSCNGGGSGRVDRRNMLLGLGGLYGASSLVGGRRAEADPLQPPDLSICDPEGVTTSDRNTGKVIHIDADCCPPYNGTDPDAFYVPPVFDTLKKRPAAHRMTAEYLADYKLAIQMMKDLDTTDPDDPRGFTQQANIHCAYCNGPYDQRGFPTLDIQVHNSWIFFPFHRWYLYFFERICGELIGKPDFALPYWNWDNPDGMYLPPPFAETYSPLYDCNRDQTHYGDALVDLSFAPGVSVDANLNQMQQEMIVQGDTISNFMGAEYRAGMAPLGTSSGGTSEQGSHANIHVWTGNPKNTLNEDMGNFYSAGRDPIFYCHHANVDRMWTIWNDLHPTIQPFDDPDFLNAAFLFYDEQKNLVKVRVADCLDYRTLGYQYEFSDIRPWLNYVPPTREVSADVQELAKTAQAATQAFPATLAETIRVVVNKPSKGKADEVLVIEGIVTDNSKQIGFDVYVNDDENTTGGPVIAERVGGFTQVPHRSRSAEVPSDLSFNLKELYKNINIADDDDIVVVTIVPRTNGDAVTIGGIKIIPRTNSVTIGGIKKIIPSVPLVTKKIIPRVLGKHA